MLPQGAGEYALAPCSNLLAIPTILVPDTPPGHTGSHRLAQTDHASGNDTWPTFAVGLAQANLSI